MADPTEIIKHAVEQNPLKMQDSFNDLILDKIRDAVEIKKAELAQQFLGFDNSSDDQEINDQPEDEQELEIDDEDLTDEDLDALLDEIDDQAQLDDTDLEEIEDEDA